MTNETKQVKLHSRGGAKRLARIALFTALTAVCAQISIPLPGGVPITLQTLAVMLASIALGFDGVAAVAVYVFLGLIGVPVFYKFGATPRKSHGRLYRGLFTDVRFDGNHHKNL